MSKIEVNEIDKTSGSTLTLGGSGTAVTLACGATQTGFGRTGTVDWQTGSIKTATFTAANGEGYFANTSGGAFTMNLPSATAGNIVSVVDYTNTFQTNNLTISPNGSQKIGGTNATVDLSTEGQSVTLVYVDDTEGWKNVQDSTSNVIGTAFITATGGTITCSGNFKIHTFTGPGTFCVSGLATVSSNNNVDYLVVAGGGGGGGNDSGSSIGGGGAGAGGYRESPGALTCYTASPLGASPAAALPVSVQGYPITVGAGGAAGTGGACGTPTPPGTAGKGNNSIFSTITSTGGGGGHSRNDPTTSGGAPMDGGSGGGESGNAPPGTAGDGNTPPVNPSQGFPGGNTDSCANSFGSAGGGGATAAAVSVSGPTSSHNSTAGGAGTSSQITASPVAYSGGGGGGGANAPSSPLTPSPAGGAGGSGGGGAGGPAAVAGTSGTANTGGGGGGGGAGSPGGVSRNGGTGGSGVVIIRYKFQ